MSSNGLRPLRGIRVLDLKVALAGPHGTLLLDGMGAEVIRVEAPGGDDIARTNVPFDGDNFIIFGAQAKVEVSLKVPNRARNKKSITLDLKSLKGHEILMRLARECGVPCARVRTPDKVLHGPDLQENSAMMNLQYPKPELIELQAAGAI